MRIILMTLLIVALTGCTKPVEVNDTPEPQIKNQEESTATTQEETANEEEIEEESETDGPSSEMPPSVKKVDTQAKVTITKFFDFACGYCRRGAQSMQALQEKFGDDLSIELRHFVVHPSVLLAHKASECAREQDKFEAFFYEYFQNHFAQTTDSAFKKVGEKIGLDQNKFESCIASNKAFPIIEGHKAMGELIGVTGTPTFVINNQEKVSGAMSESQFEKLIQKYLDDPIYTKK